MPVIYLNLVITPEEFQRLYEGSAKDVLAHSVDGRRVRFPAGILRRYVTREGIRGRFKLSFDESNRFLEIEKID